VLYSFHMNDSLTGKKVFFLYPPSVIRDEVYNHLLEQEFEVYLIRSHEAAAKLLRLNPNSIMFVNIDDGQPESEWEVWIKNVMSDPATKTVGIGILSYNTNDDLKKKYLMDIGISCGFIRLKLGLEESSKILIETLNANEAKGRRKYVRATCENDHLSTVNVRAFGGAVNGNLRDISVVGCSVTFETDPKFQKNSLLKDMQLKLRGSLVKAEGIVFGSRQDAGTVYVILFTKNLEPQARAKIRRYIQTTLQSEVDSMIK
jgi:hypothetical protein